MKLESINSPNAHSRNTGYSQAIVVSGHTKTVYVSGQIPTRVDGSVPESFEAQAEQVWSNIEAQLHEAGMDLTNIVRHTTYLSDRCYRDENSKVRKKVLGELQPALTVIIAGIFDESWLLEIEAVAVK